jgi:putative ABC transport system permease protein
VSVWTKKLIRELRLQKGQSAAVATVTALGVMMFVVSAAAYRDLRDSYAGTRSRLRLATVQVELPSLSPASLAAVRGIPGVGTAEPRLRLEVAVVIDDRHPTLRVESLPEQGQPELDRVLVIDGTLPSPGQLLLEKHFAQHHHLTVGSPITPSGGARALTVSGIAVSPEYLWVSRDENDPMPTPDDFGVGWMRRSQQRALAEQLVQHGADPAPLELARSAEGANELLVEGRSGVMGAALAGEVDRALGQSPQIHAVPGDELPGVKLMQMDLDGYKGMAVFFPFFFLSVAAFIVGSAMARLVDAQRATIGTLMALGVGGGRVLTHYVGFAVTLGGVGGVLGAALGQAVAPALTAEYAGELSIPFVEWHGHPGLGAAGAALGAGVALLAGALPAIRAMRLRPGEAMRPARPRLGALAASVRRLPAPLPVKLALRDVLGRPLRSLSTSLGIAAALVLVLATGVLLDSMKATLRVMFNEAQTYDVRVDFPAPIPAEAVLDEARQAAGVSRAEPLLALPATVEAHGARVGVLLQAHEPGARLLRPMDVDGHEVAPGEGELTLTRAAAKKLRVSPGDRVDVAPPRPGVAPISLTLKGFADAAMGSTATVRRADLDRAWHTAGLLTTVLAASSTGGAQARASLAKIFPHALRVEDAAATRAMFNAMMGLGWVMVGFMLAFAGVLAAAILFNTATLTVLEHERDFATLRALGWTMRELSTVVTLEHALLSVVGLALGVPLAAATARAMLEAFSSELFSLPYVLELPTVSVAIAGVLGCVLLAQWPALRRVSRADLAASVRAREG